MATGEKNDTDKINVLAGYDHLKLMTKRYTNIP